VDEFIEAFRPQRRKARVESERFRSFGYDELVARDEADLDTTRLKDASLEDLDHLPAPEVIAREIVDDLTAALADFEAVAAAPEGTSAADPVCVTVLRTVSPPGWQGRVPGTRSPPTAVTM
jgi:type I restriction enzyme M protein